MITQKDALELVDIIKKIDVKDMVLENENKQIEKWFRFGNFNALQIVCKLILESAVAEKETKVS